MRLYRWLQFHAAHPIVQRILNHSNTADTVAFFITKILIGVV